MSSHKCPLCGEWKDNQATLIMHLRGIHKLARGFQIRGEGENTKIIHLEPKQRRGGCG